MAAIFAQPTKDENLTPGWTVQGTGSAARPGPDAAGYGSTEANYTANYGPGQLKAGMANPPGAEDVGAETALVTEVLVNPGYADGTGPAQTKLGTGNMPAAPTMTSGSASTNPTSLVATVANDTPGDVTAVTIKDSSGKTVSTSTQSSGKYTVPPGGSIDPTFSGGNWTWTV